MDMPIHCPIECVRAACPDPDFIEKNGTWLLTAIGGITATMGVLLTYFLKSRCRKMECCCLKIDRDPIAITEAEVEVSRIGGV